MKLFTSLSLASLLAASVVQAGSLSLSHLRHRHRRGPVAIPDALAASSHGNDECYTYVTSWLVDYVPPTTTSAAPVHSTHYTSTDYQYVYVTVEPTEPASSSSSSSSRSDLTTTKTKHVELTVSSTMTVVHETTIVLQTTEFASSSSSPSSSSLSSSSTSSPSSSISSPPSSLTSTLTSTSTLEDEVTSTQYSTVTIFVTVTPIISTAYATTVLTPGTYAFPPGTGTATTTVLEPVTVTYPTAIVTQIPDLSLFLPAGTTTSTKTEGALYVTAHETAYVTVSCTPGVYTFGSLVTTVTEYTEIAVPTATL
ncbi:hypothetical protein V1514DRAFT_350656 [Lipomyces japonicus]|uniref:uncharacterized protein n=1 Tax=Lipomyces japonicus TaxID=56871 RepID=UPI0034CF63AE